MAFRDHLSHRGIQYQDPENFRFRIFKVPKFSIEGTYADKTSQLVFFETIDVKFSVFYRQGPK